MNNKTCSNTCVICLRCFAELQNQHLCYIIIMFIVSGDFNGDGFDDVIIGAPYASEYRGQTYILFGSAHGVANINLQTGSVPAGVGITITGDALYDISG